MIPVFPGTNCEYDTARAFERAGAKAKIVVIRNLSQQALRESIAELERGIRESQIVMIPGGFSGGDEPEGSGKFICAVFRNPAIREAVTAHLEQRDGLMLGICNGFQALIKLGLVPYGRIVDTDENCPTLTFNNIGRHQSMMVNTVVSSVKSPWLARANVGDIHTVAISHGEGKFVASPAAVSYTHLDVYKRQASHRTCPPDTLYDVLLQLGKELIVCVVGMSVKLNRF